MKQIGKVVACILAFALFAYLVLVDYAKLMDQLTVDPASSDSQAAAEESSAESSLTAEKSTDEQIAALENDIEALKAELQPVQVAICFSQISQGIYDQAYPILAEYGNTGLLTFSNDLLTGDYNLLSTDQFLELVSDGWEYAVSGEWETNDTQDWADYLDDYLNRIEQRSGVIPTNFVFRPDTYQQIFDGVLQEMGFTASFISAEEFDNAAVESDGIKTVTSVWIDENSDVNDLAETLNRYSAVLLCCSFGDDAGQVNGETLRQLMNVLSSNDNFEVTTASELVSAESSGRAELLNTIEEKTEQLEQLIQ